MGGPTLEKSGLSRTAFIATKRLTSKFISVNRKRSASKCSSKATTSSFWFCSRLIVPKCSYRLPVCGLNMTQLAYCIWRIRQFSLAVQVFTWTVKENKRHTKIISRTKTRWWRFHVILQRAVIAVLCNYLFSCTLIIISNIFLFCCQPVR